MDNTIEVGSELLDYMTSLTEIAAELVNAQIYMKEIRNILNDSETYEGEAKEPMVIFMNSLQEHIERLQIFYQKAATYAYNIYENMYKSDIAMAAWILQQMGSVQVSEEET